jgi:hypothetical protein
MEPPFLLLHASDNILIAARHIAAGEVLPMDGGTICPGADVPIGHKLARTALPAGEKVMRYGAPIGSLTQPVAAGDHVHLHNLQSDYIATHDREAVAGQIRARPAHD